MYYLHSDPDDSLDTAILLKCETILPLIEKIQRLENWTISDQPINWDEEDYILI